MKRGGHVTFSHEMEAEDHNLAFEVTAEISDYHPAVMYLRNGDPGYPEEGGDVEDLFVTMPSGVVIYNIPPRLYETLCDRAIEEHSYGD